MGKAALDGLQGISRVERGFKGMREINTVHYDPNAISTDEMVKALKGVGTYIGTAD